MKSFRLLALVASAALCGCAHNNAAPTAAASPAPAPPPAATSKPVLATGGGNSAIPVPDLSHVPAAQRDEGDSTVTAVAVPADAPNEGVDFENNWIYDKFGRFRRAGGGTGTLEGRRYDVVKVELPDGTFHTVFFDITENWNAWKPQPKP